MALAEQAREKARPSVQSLVPQDAPHSHRQARIPMICKVQNVQVVSAESYPSLRFCPSSPRQVSREEAALLLSTLTLSKGRTS